MTNPLRLMPQSLDLGRLVNYSLGEAVTHYERHKEGDTFTKNNHNYREVMGFFLPAWQRPLVWTEDQKIRFIESTWLGLNLGTYTFNRGSINHPLDNLLIDGQQRMSALEEYLNDKFPVFGYLYSQTTIVDKRFWENSTTFGCYICESKDEEYLKNYYNLMNFGGTAHTEDQRA